MAGRKRLVLFVEGEGDKGAVHTLVKRLLADQGAFSFLALDPDPFVVGNVAEVTAKQGEDFLRWLGYASRKSNDGAVLVLLDGDAGSVRREIFCPVTFARRLADLSRQVGGGAKFSVAIVFVLQEFESWCIACAGQLAGSSLPDGRPGLPAGTLPPPGDLEIAPRDAKKWLDERLESGYKPTRDQELLTRLMVGHLDAIRQRPMRSFLRLEHALAQLVEAIRSGQPIVSPVPPEAC